MVLLLKIFNDSISLFSGPYYWKHVKVKLLAKEESICFITEMPPISLLDTFLKILERLFLSQFKPILKNRGLLHDSRPRFRENFRLQSRVSVLINVLSPLMSGSVAVSPVFVDFK